MLRNSVMAAGAVPRETFRRETPVSELGAQNRAQFCERFSQPASIRFADLMQCGCLFPSGGPFPSKVEKRPARHLRAGWGAAPMCGAAPLEIRNACIFERLHSGIRDRSRRQTGEVLSS